MARVIFVYFTIFIVMLESCSVTILEALQV